MKTLRVWFHWPLAHLNLPPKPDDYHQPERSLGSMREGGELVGYG